MVNLSTKPKMNSFVVFGALLLFVVASASIQKGWVDYRSVRDEPTTVQPPASSSPDVNCTQAGPKCGSDCKTLYLCIKDGENWKPKEIYKCDDGTSCNVDSCSATPSSQCSLKGKQFSCASIEGVYPDPADCKKFHYCVPEDGKTELLHKPSSCTDNYTYNPRTTYCDVVLPKNGSCPTYVPLCKAPGQTGALSQNPSLYYICMSYSPTKQDSLKSTDLLYPYLYLCPNGKKYNGKFDCQ